MKMTLSQAVEEVLEEDSRTRDSRFDWLFFYLVLRKLGFRLDGAWSWDMPHPESITRERRRILNTKNKYPETFEPEKNVEYIPKISNHT